MSIHKHSDRTPWDYIQPWDVELCGPQIQDEAERRRWSIAFAIAGGLPFIWKELARPISDIVYGLLELRRGDKVLLIGEGIEPAGWDEEMHALVGPEGMVDCVEIILEGRRRTIEKQRGRKGVGGTWEWAYTYDKPAGYYDAVAVMQSTQHCDDWNETSSELVRVLKPGRRIVLAEAVLVGATMQQRVNSDVHLRQWYEKALGFANVKDIPYISGEELRLAFGEKVADPRVMEWHGIEMFWGRKPAEPSSKEDIK